MDELTSRRIQDEKTMSKLENALREEQQKTNLIAKSEAVALAKLEAQTDRAKHYQECSGRFENEIKQLNTEIIALNNKISQLDAALTTAKQLNDNLTHQEKTWQKIKRLKNR